MKINKNIMAHRGVFNNIDIIENTIPSFKKALELNYPIELDIQLTKDNKLVVFHDYNLMRLANKNIIIQDSKYNDIKNIKLLNTNNTIPLLCDVLELINQQVLVNIEIKNTNRIKETIDELIKCLNKYNYKNFIIQSFNPKIVRYIKNNYKDIEVGLLINDNYKNPIINLLFNSNYILKYANPDFLSISKKLLKKEKYIKLSKLFPTIIWTIKDKSEITDDSLIYISNNLL